MGTRILELDTIQYPGSSNPEIQVGSGTVTVPTGVNVDINGGNIDATTIGSSSAAAGSFTTVNASGTITGNVTGNITGNVTGDVTGDVKSPNGTVVLNNGSGSGTDSTFTGTSTNATHVQVTDNENTNENNPITFVENAQTSSGNHGLEMDGDLTYNPSTGTVASTAFSGNGSALTSLNASNISSGTIASARVPTLNQNTTGSAATLTTGRTISMTGDVAYTSASFNGSGNVTGTATIQASAVETAMIDNNAVTKAKIPSGYTFVKDDYVESTSGGGGAWIGGGPFSLLKNPYTGGYQYTLPANTTTYITCGGGNMVVGEVNDTNSSQPDRRGYGGTQMLSYGTSSGSYSTNIMGNNAKVRSHTSTTYENADGYYLPAPPFVTKIVNSTNADVSYYFQYRYMPVTSVTYGGFFAYNPWSFQQTQALSGGGTFSLLDTRVYIKFETYQD